MSRKDFASLAWELRHSYPEPGRTSATDLGSDYFSGRERQWEACVIAVTRACREANPRFNHDRFAVAAGLIRRPDGSMFPMAAPR